MLPDIKATKGDTPLVAYADDFVITVASEAVLRDKVKPSPMSFKRLGSGLSADTRTNLLIGSSGSTSDVRYLAIGYFVAKRSIEIARSSSPIGLADCFTTTCLVWHP